MKGNKMNTLCHFCGNKNLKQTKVQYIYRQNQEFFIVNDVPCLQCEYCGEEYFEGLVLKNIEKKFREIYLHGTKAKNEIRVPVEAFSDLQYST